MKNDITRSSAEYFMVRPYLFRYFISLPNSPPLNRLRKPETVFFVDPRRLTEGALNACRELHINPVDLMDKTQEDFSRDTTGVNYHPGQEVAVPKEIVEVRYSHYQNKRKSKARTRCSILIRAV